LIDRRLEDATQGEAMTDKPIRDPIEPPPPAGCVAFDSLMDRAHAGDSTEPLSAAENAALLDHLESCASCGELFDALGGLAAGADDSPLPSPQEFARLRARVLERLPVASFPSAGVRGVGSMPAFAGRGRRLALAAGLAVVLLGGGVLLGGLLAGRGASQTRSGWAAGALPLDGAVRYQNVRLDPRPDGRLRLRFDAVRPLEVEVSADDPLAVEILAQALTGGSASLGDRLRAVQLATALPEPRIREALGVAMRHDDNLGVRLAAQRGLVGLDTGSARGGSAAADATDAAHAADAETEQAMLDLLGEDGPLPMYLIAIDYLQKRGVAPWRVREALRAGARERRRGPAGSPAALLLARAETASGFLHDARATTAANPLVR
jgi:hypothetical protein